MPALQPHRQQPRRKVFGLFLVGEDSKPMSRIECNQQDPRDPSIMEVQFFALPSVQDVMRQYRPNRPLLRGRIPFCELETGTSGKDPITLGSSSVWSNSTQYLGNAIQLLGDCLPSKKISLTDRIICAGYDNPRSTYPPDIQLGITGTIDGSESSRTTIRREAYEELGQSLDDYDHISTVSVQNFTGFLYKILPERAVYRRRDRMDRSRSKERFYGRRDRSRSRDRRDRSRERYYGRNRR